jgi:hypothetical protein
MAFLRIRLTDHETFLPQYVAYAKTPGDNACPAGLNPGRRGGKPVTNRLSYGTDMR